jgi:hypothetical protein
MNIPGTVYSFQLGEAHLPRVFQAGRAMDHHHRAGFTAFARAVVHNANTGTGGVNHDLRIRGVLPMMQPQEQVDGTNAIIRAHQLEFFVLGQIARWTVRNFPNVTYTPTDIGSSALLGPLLNLAQYGLGAPAPGNAVLIVSPVDRDFRARRDSHWSRQRAFLLPLSVGMARARSAAAHQCFARAPESKMLQGRA